MLLNISIPAAAALVPEGNPSHSVLPGSSRCECLQINTKNLFKNPKWREFIIYIKYGTYMFKNRKREKGDSLMILHINQSRHNNSLPIIDNLGNPSIPSPLISFNNRFDLPSFYFNYTLSTFKKIGKQE